MFSVRADEDTFGNETLPKAPQDHRDVSVLEKFRFQNACFLTTLKCHQRSRIYPHWWAIRLSVDGTLLDRGIAEKKSDS